MSCEGRFGSARVLADERPRSRARAAFAVKLLLASQEIELSPAASRWSDEQKGDADLNSSSTRKGNDMKTVFRCCALAIAIWVSFISPSSALQALSADEAMMAHLLTPWLLIARLATIWVLLRLGWSALSSSRAKVRRFQPRPLPNFSNPSHHGRKLWTR